MSRASDLHESFTDHLASAFGIELTEEDRAACLTSEGVERVVLDRLALGGPDRLLLPVARERTRAVLAAVAGRDVALDEDLEEVFPSAGRRSQWRAVAQELDFRAPSAGRPWWVPLLIVSVPIVVGSYLNIIRKAEHFFWRWYHLITWDVIVGASLGVAVVTFVATRFVAVRIPFGTGEDVAVGLATEHTAHKRLNGGDARWSVEQVREVLAILGKLYHGAA